MKQFLWHEGACDGGAFGLWTQAADGAFIAEEGERGIVPPDALKTKTRQQTP